jgi:hypothetical protein
MPEAAVWSKNKRRQTAAESRWVDRVAQLPCSVCDQPGPSEVHEPKQGLWYCSIALCESCHRGPVNGLSGQRRMWALRKMDELDALAVTLQRMDAGAA